MLQVLINTLLLYKIINIIWILFGTNVIVHYDSVNATIHHVEYPWKVPSSCKRCEFCKTFYDNNLHSALNKLLRQQEHNYKSTSNATTRS